MPVLPMLLLVAACDSPDAPLAERRYSMEPPAAPPAAPQPAAREKCYGIAPAYANDGIAPPGEWREEGQVIAGAGTATRDGDGMAWIYVPQGSCAGRGGRLQPFRGTRPPPLPSAGSGE